MNSVWESKINEQISFLLEKSPTLEYVRDLAALLTLKDKFAHLGSVYNHDPTQKYNQILHQLDSDLHNYLTSKAAHARNPSQENLSLTCTDLSSMLEDIWQLLMSVRQGANVQENKLLKDWSQALNNKLK